MTNFEGFFDLKTPRDLLRKLEHDYQRILNSANDTYPAFDFFVTAEHMLDWIHPNDEPARRALRDDSVLLQICSHIANGSKHFKVDRSHHKSVKDTKTEGAAFDRGAFDHDAFQVGELRVDLKGDAVNNLGDSIQVQELARKVLEFWMERLKQT